jgi:radical SAM superfamily enzyme YgiQ (UPF0313 family)
MKTLLIFPKTPVTFFSFPKAMRLMGNRTLYPPLGLITVAALLPREWRLSLVDLNVEPVTEQLWAWADLVMISGMFIQRPQMLALVREAKARGKTVVAGGSYPTLMPEELLDAGVDFLIKGEGEVTIPKFLADLAAGRRGGLIECDERPDLTASPLPRFDLLDLKAYNGLSLQTSRGCPHDCEFCDVFLLYGRRPRYKSPLQVAAELEAIYRVGWRGQIFICDDNFIASKPRARAILQEMIAWNKNRGKPFVYLTQATVSLGQDPSLMELMSQANFGEVFLGIETPEEEALVRSGKHHNRLASLEESINNVKAHGLSIIGSFILGMDGEKPGAGDRIITLIEATSLPSVMVNFMQPIPHTRFWQRLEREGRLMPEQFTQSRQIDSIGIKPLFATERPQEEIVSEYLKIWTRAYEPRRFLERAYRFALGMRPAGTEGHRGQDESRPVKKALKTLRQQWGEAFIFFAFSWQLGVILPTRRQYWRQLLGILKNNPSRALCYLMYCGRGEDMFDLRDLICRRLTGARDRNNSLAAS